MHFPCHTYYCLYTGKNISTSLVPSAMLHPAEEQIALATAHIIYGIP
jgi:hypothetical protein